MDDFFSECAITTLMLDDAAAIVHNQHLLAGIHCELDRNSLNPFEQDFIYRDHLGKFPSEPKSFECKGVTITSRILHQTGARISDIRGADLLYEIENEKFGLIQYKRAQRGVVHNDAGQTKALLGNCPDACSNKSERPIPASRIPTKVFSFCGCWYNIIEDGRSSYLPACEAEAIFGLQNSRKAELFRTGLRKNTFLDLFSSCRVGALLRYDRDFSYKETYSEQLQEDQHAILEIRQLGLWP